MVETKLTQYCKVEISINLKKVAYQPITKVFLLITKVFPLITKVFPLVTKVFPSL